MESNPVDTAQNTQISDATREGKKLLIFLKRFLLTHYCVLAILKAAKAIKDADALLFTSGAGMSVGKYYHIIGLFSANNWRLTF